MMPYDCLYLKEIFIMRNVYLISYDVCDAKRLRRTYKTMCGFGDSMQFSVFRCELSKTERQSLKEKLWNILNWNEDRVLVIDLGPTGGRGDQCIEYWGEPRMQVTDRSAAII
jgi:CRISPR-associated protein Cas2